MPTNHSHRDPATGGEWQTQHDAVMRAEGEQ